MIPTQLKRTFISFEKAEKKVSTLLSKLIDSRIIFSYPRLSTPYLALPYDADAGCSALHSFRMIWM